MSAVDLNDAWRVLNPREMRIATQPDADKVQRLERRIAELERALLPFAWCAEQGRLRGVAPWNLSVRPYFEDAEATMRCIWTPVREV